MLPWITSDAAMNGRTGSAVVLLHRDTGFVKQEFGTAGEIAAPGYQAHLRAANAAEADIYLTVNTLKPESFTRTKDDIHTVRHVYLDVDGGGMEAVTRNPPLGRHARAA